MQCHLSAIPRTLVAVAFALAVGTVNITAAQGPIPWQAFGPGEYIGPARSPHVPDYHLRVDDDLEFVYRLTREPLPHEYLLEVGDVIRVESMVDPALGRELTVQSDGTVDMLLLGEVRVAGRPVAEIRADLNERYKKYYKVTDINVTRVKTQARLEELRAAVDGRALSGGQGQRVRVTPEGTISLPSVGVVTVQGLTLEEVQREANERYRQVAEGLEVTPILAQRAPRFVYVMGEVQRPGRYEMVQPTTAMQAVALAGGWTCGSNLCQIVVCRRTEDWSLVATRLSIGGGPQGTQPGCEYEVWLRDSDVVLVPTKPNCRLDGALKHLFSCGTCAPSPTHCCDSVASSSTLP